MKKDSILINLSRGEIIENTEDIKNALISGKLRGYGTDVWINEPPLEKIHYILIGFKITL